MVATRKNLIGIRMMTLLMPRNAELLAQCQVSLQLQGDPAFDMDKAVRRMLAREIAGCIADSSDLLDIQKDKDIVHGVMRCAGSVIVMTPQQVLQMCSEAYDHGQRGTRGVAP